MLEVIKKRVLVKSDGKRIHSDAGIIHKESADGALRRGTVMAVGSMVREDIKEGDRVCFLVQDGYPVEYNGEKFILFYEGEILGKLEGEN